MKDTVADAVEVGQLHAIDGGLTEREKFKRDKLATSDSGKVLPTHGNLLKIMKYDSRLRDMVAFDSFSLRRVMLKSPPAHDHETRDAPGPYPRLQSDEDVTRVLAYAQTWWATGFKRSTVEECLLLASREAEVNPPLEWLATLKWDGTKRLGVWLTKTFGVEPDRYHMSVSEKFLVAAVRRLRQPGCKFDTMLVLEGKQGIGKSQALAILAGPDWFTDDVPEKLTSRDTPLSLCGKWIVEFAEIEHLIRAEVETVKAFLSRTTDRYRPLYAKNPIDVPRQCVLAGTTNSDEYLRDSTGARRFWCVKCLSEGAADLDWLRENREQLWAEAAHLEANGATIWLNDEDVREVATTIQASRMLEDAWSERVRRVVLGHTFVQTPEILDEIQIPVKDQGRAAEQRVAAILRSDGWERTSKWCQGKTRRGWIPSGQLIP